MLYCKGLIWLGFGDLVGRWVLTEGADWLRRGFG